MLVAADCLRGIYEYAAAALLHPVINVIRGMRDTRPDHAAHYCTCRTAHQPDHRADRGTGEILGERGPALLLLLFVHGPDSGVWLTRCLQPCQAY